MAWWVALSGCLTNGDAWRDRRAALVCEARVVDADGDGASVLGPPPAGEEAGKCPAPAVSDCDDADPGRTPGGAEVLCNALDDDCDDATPDVVAELAGDGVDGDCDRLERCYEDLDNDGFGAYETDASDLTCSRRGLSTRGGDCDDDNAAQNPRAAEVCNHRDDDCDELVDDADPDLDPSELNEFALDADGDGFGSPTETVLACFGVGADPPDCDDGDPLANVDQDWFVDEDGDGAGAGAPVVFQCLNPGDGLAPAGAGIDCAPADPAVAPTRDEAAECTDGQDQDCDVAIDCDDPDCRPDGACRAACADAEWAPTQVPALFQDDTELQDDALQGSCAFDYGGRDFAIWFTPPVTGRLRLSTLGTAFDTLLFATEYCYGPELRCNDDRGSFATLPAGTTSTYPYTTAYPYTYTYTYDIFNSDITVDAVAGVPFLIVVDGYNAYSFGPFSLSVDFR